MVAGKSQICLHQYVKTYPTLEVSGNAGAQGSA